MLDKIKKKMNWFNALSMDEVMEMDTTEMTEAEAFWFGFKNGFMYTLPYYMIIYSVIGFAACMKSKGIIGLYKKLK